jgi:hypothetical protein
MPGLVFMSKDKFVTSTVQFMEAESISFLAIMFAFYNDSGTTLKRQLALCGDDTIDMNQFVDTLLSSEVYSYVSLDLELVDTTIVQQTEYKKFHVQLFDQTNLKPSRKQIGPMLEIVYETYLLL